MKIISLDLSLTAPGVGRYDNGLIYCGTLAVGKLTGMSRLDYIYEGIWDYYRDADLVVVEGLSFAHNNPSAQERAGLWFMIARSLWKRNTPMRVVAPTQLKKFVVGKGNADKALMIREVFRRWQFEAEDDNAADAYGLLRIGMCLEGLAEIETLAQRQVIAALNGKGKVK